MTKDQAETLASLLKIQICVDQLLADRPIGNLDNARRELRRLIDAMKDQSTLQASALIDSRSLTQQKEGRRRRLVRQMLTVSRIAACDLRSAPEFKLFVMPRRDATNEHLADVAHEMADAAEPYTRDFVSAGLPLDFIDQLHLAAEHMLDSRVARRTAQARRVGATAAMHSLCRHARHIVGVLDALINVAFQSDPTKLERWSQLKHRPAA